MHYHFGKVVLFCFSDRNQKRPLQLTLIYPNNCPDIGFSDRNQKRPLQQCIEIIINTLRSVSVIEIRSGHFNFGLQLKHLKITVSVIEIRSGHFNLNEFGNFYQNVGFSDRNQKRPLQLFILIIVKRLNCFSDRNQKRPLQHSILVTEPEVREFQ